MTSRKPFVSFALILGLVLLGAGPAPASLCAFDQIVIFAFNSAHVSRDASATGDVVANSESPGPVLEEGAEVALDRNATVTGNVSGHTIDLDTNATIAGDATYVELSNAGSITGTQTIGAPPYTDVPAFQEADVRTECVDVFVPHNGLEVLGDEDPRETCYGDVVLEKGATVVFSGGGRFDIRSIGSSALAAGACPAQGQTICRSIEFDAPTELRIEGRVQTDKGTYVGPAAGSGIDASDIVMYVGGFNGGLGGPLDTPFAVNIGRESDLDANIYAPNGTIEIDRSTVAVGAFLGKDVELQNNVSATLDSAFVNQSPVANDQAVITNGANPLVIILEGSDPEGADLSFSIPGGALGPSNGSVGAITPIIPSPLQLCSLSGNSCTLDTDCPSFAEGETCETVQPPVTQASVTYTPNAADLEDFFTFVVTDDCGDQGSAIVSINGGTDETPDDPGPGVANVEANDSEIDAVVNQTKSITLSAAAPNPPVTSLTFRVESLPAGTLLDSNASPVVAGVDLPSPVLSYTAPGSVGSDSFIFSARDSATSAPPCGPPSCDTATVNSSVGNLPELAPDQSVATDLNQPVQITLLANSGGTGGGAGPISSAPVSLSYGENGPPISPAQLSRLAQRSSGGPALGSTEGFGPEQLSPTAIAPDAGWNQFGWCDVATSPTCSGTLLDLVNETEVIESPFEFTVTAASCIRVTDTLAKGDHWRVEAQVGGNIDWTDFTSDVPQSTVGTTSDPNVAFGDLSYSHGQFDIDAGAYSVRLITIPPDSFSWGTAGFIRVDTGPCVDIVWTVQSLPTGGTLTNLDGSPVSIGDTYFSQPTLVFTPTFNFSGATFFQYQVEQGGTVGVSTIDTAIIDIVVSTNDPCILVGRDPGCIPGGIPAGPQSQGGEQEALEREVAAGPNEGLTLVVEGPGGTVSSAPIELSGNRFLRGIACSDGECNKVFPVGATVTLFARPDGDDFEFVGWSGACWGSDQITTVQLTESTVCTATFRERAAE